MKINIRSALGLPPKIDSFVEDLEKGVGTSKFDPNPGHWRVSSLVYLWDEKNTKKRDENLYKYLAGSIEEDIDTKLAKVFDIGHSVHHLVKKYLDKSPHFNVIGDEVPIRHNSLPLTGTVDHVIKWDKYPNTTFVAEIKSCNTEGMNRPIYGARIKPFKKHRWQAGIYALITGYTPIVIYYDKNTSEIVAHMLQKEDYIGDVEEMLIKLNEIYDKWRNQ